MDFETGLPVAGAAVSESQIWDIFPGHGPDYVTRAKTDRTGRFRLNYPRLDSYIRLVVSSKGYSRFHNAYAHDRHVVVRLKKRISPYRPLPNGLINLRLTEAGELYGWIFSEARMTASEDSADILPTFVDPATWGKLRVKALGKGGIKFISQTELRVDNLFLLYTDTAPSDGYQATADLNFPSKEGGIYFVRTRDGEHFAKIEFNASPYSGDAGNEIARYVNLRYVYNDRGSRDLRYQDFR